MNPEEANRHCTADGRGPAHGGLAPKIEEIGSVVTDVPGAGRPEPVDVGRRISLKLDEPVVCLVDDDAHASLVGEQAEGAPLVIWPFPSSALDTALRGTLVTARTAMAGRGNGR